MIETSPFGIEPWCVRETSLDVDRLAHTESVFTLANGHIGLRGNLDEGDPHGVPGTYLNSFCELRPLPYAEGGYGYPESGQAILNVTNGKLIRLLVDDEPLDIRYGQLRSHERVLDFRTGVLSRSLEWVSPAGKAVTVTSERLVSLSQRAIAAITYTITATDQPVLLVVQSELFANEELPATQGDPRLEAALARPLAYQQIGLLRYRRELLQQGMDPSYVNVQLVINAVAAFGRAATLTTQVRSLLGRDPIPMDRFIAEHAATWHRPQSSSST